MAGVTPRVLPGPAVKIKEEYEDREEESGDNEPSEASVSAADYVSVVYIKEESNIKEEIEDEKNMEQNRSHDSAWIDVEDEGSNEGSERDSPNEGIKTSEECYPKLSGGNNVAVTSHHEEHLTNLAKQLAASKKNVVLSELKYNAIVDHLKYPRKKVHPHFKHWVKTRKFQLAKLPRFGQHEILVVPNEKSLTNSNPSFLCVLHAGQLYTVVSHIHCTKLKHGGYKKVFQYLQHNYFGVTRTYIQEFCKTCPSCPLGQSVTNCPPQHPIVEINFLEHVQIDLIDMQHCPDGEFKYIGHFMDHFSKFHILFPLAWKRAQDVSEMLESRVLAHFGPPKTFHSNLGREFVNEIIHSLYRRWSCFTFVNGQTKTSNFQNLMDRENRMIEKKLIAMRSKLNPNDKSYPWAKWLPHITYSRNREKHEGQEDAPYYVVFRNEPPASFIPSSSQLQ